MSATKIIGNIDVFKNGFTRYGRNKNYLMQQLKDYGFSEFRERTLKDKSQVMLAYKAGKDFAEFSCRNFPDSSMVQKYILYRNYNFTFPALVQRISKIFIGKDGKTENEYIKRIVYEKGVFAKKEEKFDFRDKDVLIKKIESVKGENVHSLKLKNVVKSYCRVDGNDLFAVYEQADGTKHCVMNIDGIEHKFSSK